MFQDPSVPVTALIALLPAALSWTSGRRLARHQDDRTLPERLLSHQRRNGIVLGVAGTTIAFYFTRSIVWALPLLFSSLLLAGYPLRRALFEETWSATRYLSFFHRLAIAVYGFWLLLVSVPFLTRQAGGRDWIAGAVLAAALIAWERHAAAIFRRLVGTTPLEDGPLLERCRALARACGMPEPSYLRVDLRGGSVANAIALPSLHGNSVVFTDTLLARLDADELAAICGHELAHFEYFTPARLRQMRIATLALVAIGALVTPLARLAGVADSSLISVAWFGTFVGVLALRARGKQRQETICDQRAVALVGDGEPLISALTKIYRLARMPRRLEGRQEQASSHPSLSRRIRDIRRAAGTSPAPLAAPATFASSDGRTAVTFDPAALYWVEQAGMTHVLSYPHLLELRLDTSIRRGTRLRAVMSGARRFEMPVAAADIGRLQDVLDRVDGQLGDLPAPRGIPIGVGRLLVLAASLIALALGQIAVAAIALITWLVPATPLLAATGVAALAAAALGLRDHSLQSVLASIVMMVPGGAMLLWMASQARQDPGRNPKLALAVLSGVSAILLLSLGVNGIDPISLHLTARAAPATVVLWLALGSALACLPAPRAKRAGLAAIAVAMLAAATGAQPFLDTFGRDPFLVRSPELSWTVVDAATAREFEIPQTTATIQLAPDGTRIAALQGSESDGDGSTFQVGVAGGPLTAIEGEQLRFLDDGTLLIARASEQGTELRHVRADEPGEPQRELWRLHVPGLHNGSLSVNRGERRWRLNGYDRDDGIVRAEGTIGTPEVNARRWAARYTRDALIDAITTDGREPLVVESSYDNGVFGYLPGRSRLLGMLLNAGGQQSRYWSIGDSGVKRLGASRLGATCMEGLDGGALACSVFDGTRTRLVRLAPDGVVTGLGWLDARFAWQRAVVDGWTSGWIGSTAIAVDLTHRRALRVPRSEGMATDLAVSGNHLAALVFDGGVYKLRIYEIDKEGSQEAGALAIRNP